MHQKTIKNILIITTIIIVGCQKFVPKPSANFEASVNLAEKGQEVTFTDLTTHSPNVWIWDFGDETQSNERNPKHTYAELGTYTVKLTVINDGGYDIELKEDFIEVVNETLSDNEGNIYKTVEISGQNWMASNLLATTFNNGDSIPLIQNDSLWFGSNSPAYCWYQNNPTVYKDKYGAIYNYYTIESGNLCPDGWHVPTDEDWILLETNLGMADSMLYDTVLRGTNQGDILKSTTDWRAGDTGNNSSGFSAKPGGARYSHFNDFYGSPDIATFWTSTQSNSHSAWFRELRHKEGRIYRNSKSKRDGYYVRCIQD